MTPARFEPTILADERPQTYALDGATTGIGFTLTRERKFSTPEYFSHGEKQFLSKISQTTLPPQYFIL
jgi:hypothetical protein